MPTCQVFCVEALPAHGSRASDGSAMTARVTSWVRLCRMAARLVVVASVVTSGTVGTPTWYWYVNVSSVAEVADDQ
jgi:hypothetical protein